MGDRPHAGDGLVVLECGASLGRPLPSVGIGPAGYGDELRDRELDVITALRLSHLRVDLHLASDGWRPVLERACATSISTATGLELALLVGPDPERELEALAAALPALQARVVRFLLLPEGTGPVDASVARIAKRCLSALAPKALFASSTVGPEVERETAPAGDGFDAVVCSLAATVTADDDAARMEAARGHGDAVRAVQQLCPDRPVVVSPVTMGQRPHEAVAGPTFDVGLRSQFGAAWTLASLASLALAGASSVTYLEATAGGSGTVLPSYHVLADVLEWDFGQVGESRSYAPRDVAVLCAHTLDGQRILVANLTPELQRCRVGPLSGAQVAVRILDESNLVTACDEPERFRARVEKKRTRDGALELELGRYAYVRVNL